VSFDIHVSHKHEDSKVGRSSSCIEITHLLALRCECEAKTDANTKAVDHEFIQERETLVEGKDLG
jgi:hypothetical protein